MKKVLISLSIIAAVAAIVVGATTAYFSDTETSAGNTFSAGTIDIRVEGDNFTWTQPAVLEDMKPCYTDYFNFTIYNDGSDPNPVNVWKKLTGLHEETGVVSEPECTEQNGSWNPETKQCTWQNQNDDNNDIASIINYDLYVEVYDSNDHKIWWQTILTDADGITVHDIVNNFPDGLYLGMIPAGGYMKVIQSYHMQDLDQPTNWAQGDRMSFNIEINAVQLRGTARLENKQGAEPWKIILDDNNDKKTDSNDINGTLTYKVKNPTFDFTFTGKAPLTNTKYYLIAGENHGSNPSKWDPDTELGYATSETNGEITISGNLDINKNLKDAKLWLVPEFNGSNCGWDGSKMKWNNWPSCVTDILWETGLIWYEDTDL